MTRCLRDNNWKRYWGKVNFEIKEQSVHLRTEFKQGAMQSIKALGMRAPARVLLSSTTKETLA